MIQVWKGLAQSPPDHEAVPKLPQATVTGCVIAACSVARVSAMPLLAGPADMPIVVATPAVSGAVPATMANLADPSGTGGRCSIA